MTQRQEEFCVRYLETGKAAEAYRLAFKPPKAKAKTIHEVSSRLMKNPEIIKRIEELRAPVRAVAQLTLQTHLESLAGIRDLAISEKQLSAAVGAEVARGKVSGLYVDTIRAELTLPELIVRRRLSSQG